MKCAYDFCNNEVPFDFHAFQQDEICGAHERTSSPSPSGEETCKECGGSKVEYVMGDGKATPCSECEGTGHQPTGRDADGKEK